MLHLLLNRVYQKTIAARLNGSMPDVEVPFGGKTQQLLTMAMFCLLGRIAKMDGRVTAAEVRYASTIMSLMGLSGDARRQAIVYYRLGKKPATDVMHLIRLVRNFIGSHTTLASLFLKVQCRGAFIKGDMRLEEKVLLRDVAEALGFDKLDFLAVYAEMQSLAEINPLNSQDSLTNAYYTLQLKSDAEDPEVRKAYLRLMSRYHPDKLAKDELTEEAMRMAQDKSAAIRDAYETVCGFRKIRA